MNTPLHEQHCRHVSGAAMSEAEVQALLPQIGGWQAGAGTIERRFDFPDFHATMAFVNAVAWIAHRQDHHPDLQVGYNRCLVRWSTHSVGGLSINDFICAARVDALQR